MRRNNSGKYLINVLKIIFSLALGFVVLWLSYRDMDVERIVRILRNDVNYAWIWFAIAQGVLSNLFRALRWKMLLEVLDRKRKISTLNVFFATMLGYLVNLLFPRAGEVARCGVVSRYERLSFTKTVGTMIAERGFDMLILLSICVMTILLQLNFFSDYFSTKNLALGDGRLLLYAGIALLLLLCVIFIFRKQLQRKRFVQKIIDLLKNIWQGMKTFLYVRSKFFFLFHGLMVWLLYVGMLYACVFAFNLEAQLSVGAVFAVFVMGSLGIMIPVQGGIGTFHALTIAALAFYGVGADEAGGFALLTHGAQMAMMIVVGLLSAVALQFRKTKKAEEPAS
jgi:uncharacterized protein (TIRG00374 family)